MRTTQRGSDIPGRSGLKYASLSALLSAISTSGALALLGCSAADPSSPTAPTLAIATQAETPDAQSDAEIVSTQTSDPACDPVRNGVVCRALSVRMGYTGPMLEYSVECKDVGLTDRCVLMSLDPTKYDDTSWAYCCAGVARAGVTHF